MKIALPLGVSLGLMGVMIMLSLGMWQALPPGTQLPYHFGLGGEAGPTAPALLTLSILPAVGLLVTAVFALGARIDRRVASSQGTYLLVWLITLLVIALAQGLIIRHALFSLHA
ncbi:hypothetical protein [Neorhizobium alkalisoli]|uniref:DUF1648 domain-containing protein n=1 Tax=Neorhizobium alkalisoli TaxID=528178 RepID=A0A561QXI1_9HYPH|nr:hypothetical protein [Neorhizobium alkalisoli]TWF55053.1 hypothetical protein FHW37_103927 [Neorhizobium alkalisoli]